jgi:hypothetical protein
MGKIIDFVAQNDHVWNVRPKPYPAIKGLPKWWKETPAYSNPENKFNLDPYSTVTVKRCVPTLDMLGAGYYVPLWADLFVTQENNFPLIKWTTSTAVVNSWSDSQSADFKIIDGYSKPFFKNLHGWTIKTPPGWSCIFMHPVAYPNAPFYTIPGIVDTDVYDGEINVPFAIKDSFEGIIEKNTPMFQIIPFKRDQWESQFSVKKQDEHFFDNEKLYSKINRAYFSLIKHKKTYN